MIENQLYSVKSVMGEYKRLFGRDSDIYEVIELLPIVLRQTCNVPPEYMYICAKSNEEGKVILPCVYYSVKWVTTLAGDAERVYEGVIRNGQGILVNYSMDEWRESMAQAVGDVVVNQVPAPAIKINSSFKKDPSGKFVDFRSRGNVLTVDHANLDLQILLTLMPMDEKGFPKVTEKVITAMAYFMNLVHCQKKYYSGQLPQYVFHDAQRDYDTHAGLANTPTAMSENEMNDILNALSSYQRHSYNTAFRHG